MDDDRYGTTDDDRYDYLRIAGIRAYLADHLAPGQGEIPLRGMGTEPPAPRRAALAIDAENDAADREARTGD